MYKENKGVNPIIYIKMSIHLDHIVSADKFCLLNLALDIDDVF